jgi:hypothetical protein
VQQHGVNSHSHYDAPTGVGTVSTHLTLWGGNPLKGIAMTVGTILLIILILLLIGAIPARGRFGNAPLGIVGTILVIVVILMLLGMI